VSQRAIAILDENRKSAAEIADLASARSRGGGSQQDVYRAEVAVAEIDRELVTARQNFAEARASLAQLLHMSPEADLTPLSRVPTASVPEQVDRLYRMAVANRPALQERLAAIARDEREVELARKRYYPNITLGLEQWKMSEHGAVSRTASGVDNIGLVLGFNVPIYHKKLDAGVHEAQARTVADARRYDADRDRTYRDVKELLVQARAQRELIDLLQNTILPKSEKALELAAAAYPGGEVDFVTLNTGRLELLNIQLQIARLEAEQGKSLAALERVVGVELTEQPPQPIPDAAEASAPGAQPSAPAPPTVAAPPVAGSSSPFQHQSTPRGEPNG
jgi:outer membrane protein TolC